LCMKHRIGSVDHATRGRRNNNGHHAQGSRCGLHRRRVHWQHSCPRTDQGRAQSRRARARRRPFDARGFHASLGARRSQIRRAPGTVPRHADGDGDAAALAVRNRAAPAPTRLVPAWHRARRGRRALERRHLAPVAVRPQSAEPSPESLRP
jgi:hypothetical protein